MTQYKFPSLIQCLVRPNTKTLLPGVSIKMSTSLTSDGGNSMEFMGLTEGDVQFILKSFAVLEDTIFFPPNGEVNWVDAATQLYKASPEHSTTAPAFKQVFAYLFEAIEQQDLEAMKEITKTFADILYMQDSDDNNTYYLLPEDIFTTEIPSGKRQRRYFS